jgi:DNA-binding response OmpR family regulator
MDIKTENKNVKTRDTYSILLIENDPELRKVMKISLEQNGMKVTAVSKPANAINYLEQEIPDFFMVDFEMNGGNPGELIKTFRKTAEDKGGITLLTTTCRPDDDWRQKYQPDVVIYKPFDLRQLQRRIAALSKTISQ